MDDDEDDALCVCLDGAGRVDGAAEACATDATGDVPTEVWDDWLRLTPPQREHLCMACHRAAWPLAPGSFWLPASEAPRCELEALACAIMRFHLDPRVLDARAEHIGVEWWANVSNSDTISRPAGEAYGDIALHWDKDERAHGTLGLLIQPLISTVTYLGAAGAPTLVVPGTRPTGADGGYTPAPLPRAELVPPRAGRHLRFDGRWLHGAPASLCPASTPASYTRITFCVNIWVGHRPPAAARFAVPPAPTAGPAPPFRVRHARASNAPAASTARRDVLRTLSAITKRGPRASGRPRSTGARTGRAPGAARIATFALEQTDVAHELVLPLPQVPLERSLAAGHVASLRFGACAGAGCAIRRTA